MTIFKSLEEALGKTYKTDLIISKAGKGDKGRTLVEIECLNCRTRRIVPWYRLNEGRPKRCICNLKVSEKVDIDDIINTDKILSFCKILNRTHVKVQCLDCGEERVIPKDALNNIDRYNCKCKRKEVDFTEKYRYLIGTHDDKFNFDILNVCTSKEDNYTTDNSNAIKLIVNCCDCNRIFSIKASQYLNKHTLSKLCICKDNSQFQNSYSFEVADNIVKEKYNHLIKATLGLLTVENVGLYNNKPSVFCKCSCCLNNNVILSVSEFKLGRTVSCGCLSTSFGEYVIKNYLKKLELSFKKEYTFDDLKSPKNYKLRYDFCIQKDCNYYLIEYNGKQHYNEDSFNYDDDFEYRKLCDDLKLNYATTNNIPLLVIKYTSNVTTIENEVYKFLKKYNVI